MCSRCIQERFAVSTFENVFKTIQFIFEDPVHSSLSVRDLIKICNVHLKHFSTWWIFKEIQVQVTQGEAVQNLLSSRLLSRNVKIKIYKTIILPVVLYGCETLSLTLREEHRLRVFENTMLRRIFGPKRDEVTGGWRKLHNEELHGLYSSPSIVRVIKVRRMR
jgi:hypothetical protein